MVCIINPFYLILQFLKSSIIQKYARRVYVNVTAPIYNSRFRFICYEFTKLISKMSEKNKKVLISCAYCFSIMQRQQIRKHIETCKNYADFYSGKNQSPHFTHIGTTQTLFLWNLTVPIQDGIFCQGPLKSIFRT